MQRNREGGEKWKCAALRFEPLDSPAPVRVAVVDPDPRATASLQEAFQGRRGVSLRRCFSSAAVALQWMRIGTVHLVVLEARLETMDCLDVIGALKERPQPVRVIVLTSIADSFVREEVARAGGDAYLVKPCPVEVLFLALKGACLGTRMGWQDNWPRPENLVSHPNSGLSLIQQLILRRLVQDRTVQQIAGDLGLRFSSVHTHLARLRKRFEVHNSVALIEKSRREFPGTFRHL